MVMTSHTSRRTGMRISTAAMIMPPVLPTNELGAVTRYRR